MEELMLRAVPSEDALPYVLIDQTSLDMSRRKSAELLLTFSPSVWEHDLFLVVDLYSAANPVHPAGHVGWWKWSLQTKGDLPVRIVKTGGKYNVTFDGHEASERWTNPDFSGVDEAVLAVHFVMRPVVSEAICFEDVVHLYNSASARDAALTRRASVEETRGEASSVPWYGWPRGTKVHLVATNIFERDAIGNFMFAVARMLRANGIECQLYANTFDPALRETIRHTPEVLTAAQEENDVVFLHFSIRERWLPQIARLNCRKVIYFHNITPPRFLQVYDAEYAGHCAKGVEQVKYLNSFDGTMANSRMSAAVLRGWYAQSSGHEGTEQNGATNGNAPFDEAARFVQPIADVAERSESSHLDVTICPPLLGLKHWQQIPDEPIELPRHKSLLLYVGRVAPHKRVEDLLALFSQYHKHDPDSILLIIGGSSFGGYSGYLRYLLMNDYARLKDRIHFLGSVTDGQLRTLYRAATAFVTMSEHEGFCVPLVEAMGFDLPVFAYADSAVADTMGRAGRIYYRKDFPTIAADIADVLQTDWKRNRILDEQRRRLADIVQHADGRAIWAVLEKVMF